MWKVPRDMWITPQRPRFALPVNTREASSGTLLNFRTLPHSLQRPLLVAPLGLSIIQWCWHRVRLPRLPSAAVLRIASSPPSTGGHTSFDGIMLTYSACWR